MTNLLEGLRLAALVADLSARRAVAPRQDCRTLLDAWSVKADGNRLTFGFPVAERQGYFGDAALRVASRCDHDNRHIWIDECPDCEDQ